MKYLIALFFGVLMSINFVFAQTTGYQLGQKVQNFTLKDINGSSVSLSDYSSAKTVVVIFTNLFCPYSKLYESRITSLAKSYAQKEAKFILINPSISQQEDGESLKEMQARAQEKNYIFPYLADEKLKVTNQFGATKTPEAFVLHNVNGEFVLKYKGAIDDNPQVEEYAKDYYLKNVVDAILENQNVKAFDKRATGCMIKRF